jgi:hypothetical protein
MLYTHYIWVSTVSLNFPRKDLSCELLDIVTPIQIRKGGWAPIFRKNNLRCQILGVLPPCSKSRTWRVLQLSQHLHREYTVIEKSTFTYISGTPSKQISCDKSIRYRCDCNGCKRCWQSWNKFETVINVSWTGVFPSPPVWYELYAHYGAVHLNTATFVYPK